MYAEQSRAVRAVMNEAASLAGRFVDRGSNNISIMLLPSILSRQQSLPSRQSGQRSCYWHHWLSRQVCLILHRWQISRRAETRVLSATTAKQSWFSTVLLLLIGV